MDKFLDLSREIFCNSTEKIHELADSYKDEHGLPDLRTAYNHRRGFSLVLPRPSAPVGTARGSGGRNRGAERTGGAARGRPGLPSGMFATAEEEAEHGAAAEVPSQFQVLERKAKTLICTTQARRSEDHTTTCQHFLCVCVCVCVCVSVPLAAMPTSSAV